MNRPAAIGLLLMLLVAACRPAPVHDGYPIGATAPWAQAKEIRLDGRTRVKVEGEVAYAERRRAQWFAVHLDGGTLRLDLAVHAGPGRRLTRVGLELIAADGVVLARDHTDDGGPHHLFASDVMMAPGRFLIHVYSDSRDVPSRFTLVVTREPQRRGRLAPGCVWTGPAPDPALASEPTPAGGLPCIAEPAALPP